MNTEPTITDPEFWCDVASPGGIALTVYRAMATDETVQLTAMGPGIVAEAACDLHLLVEDPAQVLAIFLELVDDRVGRDLLASAEPRPGPGEGYESN